MVCDEQMIVQRLRCSFESGTTRSLQFRKSQLKAMYTMLEAHQEEFLDSVSQDLSKPRMEGVMFEVEFTLNVIRGCLMDIQDWCQDEYVPKNIITLLDTTYIHPEPLGVCLVIGAWNYPVQLSLCPMLGAMAAGNCVVLKPSELAPKTSHLLAKLLPTYLDTNCFAVIEGGAEVSTALLNIKLDSIFYTGGQRIGRIVAQAAAKNLTPYTLELGGKCPVYIDHTADLNMAVKRILWGKCINLGQTCVAPDYIICSADISQQLVAEIKSVYKSFYGDRDDENADLSRIINQNHFDRLVKMISQSQGKMEMEGKRLSHSRFIGLTVVSGVTEDDSLMQEEIFGPVLPIMHAESVHEAISLIRKQPKPLSLYIFSKRKEVIRQIIDNTSSGSVCCNDVAVHLSVDSLPFGGVGDSGCGAYHGKYSFDAFSHRKAVLQRDFGLIGEYLGNRRYPPYSKSKMEEFCFMLKRRRALPTRYLGTIALIISGAIIVLIAQALYRFYTQ